MTAARFQIQIDDAEIEDLRRRLEATRWPDQVGDDWIYGTPVGYLRNLCRYWAQEFDWRAAEQRLNAFDQFTIELDQSRLHFIHQRSSHHDAQPLLITHGWPGSITEFVKIIEPLTQPERHGGEPGDAFHVICPSIPGYGFSAAPRKPGFHARACAALFAKLMVNLGYPRYFAQGGDWGSAVTTWLAALDPDHVAGIHLNLVFSGPPGNGDAMAGVTDVEARRLTDQRERMRNEVGYQHIQGTKPQTLGYSLNDSPAGLAAWIVEKFHGWSQHSGDHESVISRDEILTNISVYWFTGTATSAARLYFENRRYGDDPAAPERVEVPTSVSMFPGELYLPPRVWVERQYNLVHWFEPARGGHFAAMEAPDELVADIRGAFRTLR
ncbi:MAG: epoxide hydrolase [Gammaproteobacteria bacterium]|nr:MAG: epoxide hydrolase [Gammaproteobacteria bacterium]